MKGLESIYERKHIATHYICISNKPVANVISMKGVVSNEYFI